MENEVREFIRHKAKEFAVKANYECDGSYEGEHITEDININGTKINLIVDAFWGKGMFFDFSAKWDGETYCDTVYL